MKQAMPALSSTSLSWVISMGFGELRIFFIEDVALTEPSQATAARAGRPPTRRAHVPPRRSAKAKRDGNWLLPIWRHHFKSSSLMSGWWRKSNRPSDRTSNCTL
jgi:hypothetical protein